MASFFIPGRGSADILANFRSNSPERTNFFAGAKIKAGLYETDRRTDLLLLEAEEPVPNTPRRPQYEKGTRGHTCYSEQIDASLTNCRPKPVPRRTRPATPTAPAPAPPDRRRTVERDS